MNEKALDAIRVKIASKQSELAALVAAPLLPAEVENRVDALIDHWQSVVDSDWLGRTLAAPGYLDHEDDILATACAGSNVKLPSLLATLCPSELRGFLLRSAKPWTAGKGGLSQHDRMERQQALEAELYQLEVEEEAIVVALEAAHITVYRRPDADPSVILALPE